MYDHVHLPREDELKDICSYESDFCVTISLPTEVTGKTEKNRIRFKNAVQVLRDKLACVGKEMDDFTSLEEKIAEIREDSRQWEYQAQGFLLLWSPDRFHIYHTPFSLPEKIMIDKRFYLKDLLVNIMEKGAFTVLMLNEKDVRIRKGTLNSGFLETVVPPENLKSMPAFLQAWDFEESLQFSSRQRASGSASRGAAPQYYGQGGGDEEVHNRYLEEYLKQIENWTYEVLTETNAAANFIVGDERITGLYKKQLRSTHPEMTVLSYKNTVSLGEGDLLDLVSDHMRDRLAETHKAFTQTLGARKSSIKSDIESIAAASCLKQIAELVIRNESEEEVWGHIEKDQSGNVIIRKEEKFDDIGTELINMAVTNTFLHGGQILRLEKEIFPDGYCREEKIFALVRW